MILRNDSLDSLSDVTTSGNSTSPREIRKGMKVSMIRIMPRTLAEQLSDFQQEHLLGGWDDLSPSRQAEFRRQLEGIDFALIHELHEQSLRGVARHAGGDPRAFEAHPPSALIRKDDTNVSRAEARARGEEMLANGEVGCLLVAGGQGTRLGHTLPKGVFPISPVTNATLFQLLAEQVLARSKKAGVAIPFFIMTSDATDAVTRNFFEKQDYFGLNPDDVYFFQQGTMPAVDATTGKILLAGPGCVATSPDGHGGVLTALAAADLFAVMHERGLKYLYYHQVDNPHAIVCDPEFLGHHALQHSEASTKVVAKLGPDEKMGVMIELNGRTQIIEYSDLPKSVAERRTSNGELEFWAGSTAMHVFNVDFLERFSMKGDELAFHLAHKAVSYWDNDRLNEPEKPNAYKFERFIFDVLPAARKSLVVETCREREFHPVKNATGANSPEDVREALSRMHREWAEKAGIAVPAGIDVEISPLLALSAEEFCAAVGRQPEPRKLPTGWYWGPDSNA
ncbi:MAG: UDPGP type 1 family protein [Planctomycetales bacterium]